MPPKTPMSPCKDCTDRTPGCHSRCEKWEQWQAEKEAEYQKYIRHQNELHGSAESFRKGSFLRYSATPEFKSKARQK